MPIWSCCGGCCGCSYGSYGCFGGGAGSLGNLGGCRKSSVWKKKSTVCGGVGTAGHPLTVDFRFFGFFSFLLVWLCDFLFISFET